LLSIVCARGLLPPPPRTHARTDARTHARSLTHTHTRTHARTHAQDAGNELYKAGKYVDSIVRYTAAVNKDPTVAAYLNNRAAAHMMLLVSGLFIRHMARR
jgi:hypothetical protein